MFICYVVRLILDLNNFVFFNKEIRKIVFVFIYYLYNMLVIKYMYNKGSVKLSYVIEIVIK